MSRAVLASDQRSRQIDCAQLLASTIAMSVVETAIDSFLAHDSTDAEAMLRYLQPAVMRSSLRRSLKESDVDLAAVRTNIAERIDEKVPDLEKIRRVSRTAILMTLVIGIAAMFVVSTFSNLDWNEIRNAVDDANWWWLIFAFVMAQAPRLGGSLSMMGACRTPLPYGPVVLLQFALPFIDVAAPAAAGRIAATMRFQQRYGVPAAAAFSASIIDSGVSFAAQTAVDGDPVHVHQPQPLESRRRPLRRRLPAAPDHRNRRRRSSSVSSSRSRRSVAASRVRPATSGRRWRC